MQAQSLESKQFSEGLDRGDMLCLQIGGGRTATRSKPLLNIHPFLAKVSALMLTRQPFHLSSQPHWLTPALSGKQAREF